MTEPDPEIEEVLVQRLASLGPISGAVGGVIGGGAAGAAGGALGGARGASWTAKRLKTETTVEARQFDPARGEEMLAALSRVLQCQPEYREPADQTGVATLRGIVGSGVGGLNPSYILAIVDPAAGNVSLAAHAKEGLIKQHSAEKAIRWVLTELPL